jgi:signal transduction histidine kinase
LEIRETIGSALGETERLAKIVDGLLTISRLDAGEALMEKMYIDLAHLTITTVEQMRLLAEDKSISLNCSRTEPIYIEGDSSRLKQVVVNLLDNAIKYTSEGGKIDVTVRESNGMALLEVSDTGIGISAESLPLLFERFYRTDKARSRQMGGCGLGLSIVKSICLAHNGQVNVQSTEGEGSCFSVELPLTDKTPPFLSSSTDKKDARSTENADLGESDIELRLNR